ncbi:hypothetical protein AMTR_s00086p00145680 [Amborella trichopoda]|uniref:Uncharacterized protein n=1 Tax=Amborella trichopoda TaxID=13333 RepID=W1P5A2_AMBTC|nr:hypothetical protein AMTR_s00086p00145680 [Amborella trichopoda]
MLRITGMKVKVRGPGEAHRFLANISFFSHGSPFPVGGLTDQVYTDAFGKVFDKHTTETQEAMYLLIVRGCILPYRGAKKKGIKKRDVESPEPSNTTEPEVRRKITRLSKRALSSPDAFPLVQYALSEAADLPIKPKKRAKTKASPSPTLRYETSFSLSCQSESVTPRMVEIKPPIYGSPTESEIVPPEIVQPSTLSSLSQGDFLCIIIEEGNILEYDTEAISVALDIEMTASKVHISKAKPQFQPDISLNVEPPSELEVPSSESLALVPQKPAIIVAVSPLAMIEDRVGSEESRGSKQISRVKEAEL